MADSLYSRLGGYDGIAAVATALVERLTTDEQLGRFWQHRGHDGLERERQLLIDFLCNTCGGPMYYTGRGMRLAHEGMGITDSDWSRFMGHVEATLDDFSVGDPDRSEVVTFIGSTKEEIVD